METKKCTKCGEGKDLSAFNKDCNKYDGLRTNCKICQSIQNKKYLKDNAEKVSHKKKIYYNINFKKLSEKAKKYRADNIETVREKERIRSNSNPEKRNERAKKWKKEHPEKSKEMNKKYYEANKEERNKYSKKWRKENTDKIKIYKKNCREILCDSYIKWMSFGYSKDIPKELIEAKRAQIQLLRACKE